MHPIKRMCCLGAAFAALIALAMPAQAQLALSYKLDVRGQRTEQAEVAVSPCAGFNWMTAIGVCGRELLARVAHAARPENTAVFEPAGAPWGADLPELGKPERDPRVLRSGGGREAGGTSKTADLLFRFGSKFRTRGNDESGWETHRFTDTTYDNYVKQNAHKAVGVELLVPFQ